MKKIIVVLFVASIAFFANAAAINWSMKGIQYLTDVNGKAVITTGTSGNVGAFTAYLVSSTLSDTDLLTAIKDGTLANNSAIMQSSSLAAARNGDVSINWDKANSKDYTAENAPYTFYTVILGSDYYLKTDAITILASDVPDVGEIQADFGTFTSSAAGNPTWQPVPEPTSGLLMLIGASLLALRRKQK